MGVKASKLNRVAASFGKLKRWRGAGPPLVTPRGYIPVAVGVDEETKRFMVHTTALSNAEFLHFLCMSAQEYGFCNEGILRIPYDSKAFEEWMSRSRSRSRSSPKQRIFRILPTTT